jgi:non-ribosomal peptide synthetase-like protein
VNAHPSSLAVEIPAANITGSAAPDLLREELLPELFQQQISAFAARPAVVCGRQTLTYRQLDAATNRLARALRRKGAGPGKCVALWCRRSADGVVGLLAILKSGAAYVPLDAECPPDRASYILSDCGAEILLTHSSLKEKLSDYRGTTICLDALTGELASESSEPLGNDEIGATPDNVCYVIYTSGTTGHPKGVEITHRNACHLVRAEAALFRIAPDDRVFQGFSLAFDASVEEIWLALFSGATLIVGTAEMVRSGSDLSAILASSGVTVLSCVPTLLSMMPDDVPSLRLLILGGEACPADLVKRWARPGRRIVNTYGPTETSVVATAAECVPELPVTIGRPLPNYFACVLDAALRPVPDGAGGELCIAGAGVARGYLGRPELTAQRFIEARIVDARPASGLEMVERFYRTGDLVRRLPSGEFEFLGRIDSQVKIRGFRVELAEIDAALLECSGVQAAAAGVFERDSVQTLVGYVVPRAGCRFVPACARATLLRRLPSYMVPGTFVQVPALPMLTAGKVDRKRLPPPAEVSADAGREGFVAPVGKLETRIAAVWAEVATSKTPSVTANFFLDLGGHSLLAARLVSRLRKEPSFSAVSVLDVYQHPTIRELAAIFPADPAPPRTEAAGQGGAIPFWRHFLCGTAQFVSLFFILTFFAMQWLTPYLTYTLLVEEEYTFGEAVVGAMASLILFYPLMLAVPIVVKWLVIGRYREGAYPLWGWFYFRWWFATTLEAAVPVSYLTGTPLLNIYLRLMGATVGQNVHIDTDSFASYDLLEIGEDSSINADSNLLGYTVENGLLKIGRIRIGKRCFVGARAALRANAAMEDDSALEDLSLLPGGVTIPAGQTWRGSPAGPVQHETGRSDNAAAARPGLGRRFFYGLLHGTGLLIFPVLVIAALFPGIVAMNELNYIDPYYWYLFLAPLAGLSFIVLLALEIVAIKWLLLGRVREGAYPLHSLFYFRKWFVDQTLNLSLEILGPLYASIYLAPWYRALGAKLGRGAEISTASFISPDLLTIGAESFVADSVSLGAARVQNGMMHLGRNEIGRRSFIGNSAILPPGTIIGDSVLIGCLSAPPRDPRDALRPDSTWLGSPAVFLPQRQASATFSEQVTFHPPLRLRFARALIELIRILSPSTGFIILLSLMFSAILLLRDILTLGETLMVCPILFLGCAITAATATIILKWLLVWRYRAGERPLWSTFVWRNELLNAIHEHLAEPFLVGPLTGTPFICWYFRLLGAKIGRRVYMETTDLSEFDLVHIGDEAMLNADCTVQTHLFEDRIMKMDTVRIGARAKVGAGSLVLYDTRIEGGAALGDLSLLMKGETLPANTEWEGIPARLSGGVGGPGTTRSPA